MKSAYTALRMRAIIMVKILLIGKNAPARMRKRQQFGALLSISVYFV